MPFCLHRRRIERFSYDLEMKTRAQNRNNKRTEIERFDWFIERIQTRKVFGEKNFMPENFLEINRYFALTSNCNTIGQWNPAFSILGFSWQENVDSGCFPFSQNFPKFRFGGNLNTLRRFIPLENSQKKWKM